MYAFVCVCVCACVRVYVCVCSRARMDLYMYVHVCSLGVCGCPQSRATENELLHSARLHSHTHRSFTRGLGRKTPGESVSK